MRAAAGLLAALLLLAAEPYESEILRWRDRREQALRAEDGWLSVTGLFWLKEGSNPFGTAAGNTVVLPEGSAAARAGVFEVRDGRVTARMGGAVRAIATTTAITTSTMPSPPMSLAEKPSLMEMGRLSRKISLTVRPMLL